MEEHNIFLTFLKNINTVNPKIIELGFGKGGFTKFLKKTFPKSSIIGYEKNLRFKKSPAIKHLTEARFINFTENLIFKEKENFDLFTFGSYNSAMLWWWHFNINENNSYKKILETAHFYLKSGGKILISAKTDYAETDAQKNYIKALKFIHSFDSQNICLKNNYESFHNLVEFTSQILKNIGNYKIKSENNLINKNMPEILSCKKWLKNILKNKTEKSGEKFKEIYKIAKDIDKNSFDNGQENGFTTVITAEKF